MFYTGSGIASIVLLLAFYTYAYHLALALTVVTFVLLGFLLAVQNPQKVIVSRFELSSQGICAFDDNHYYQLQSNSRFSFLGCWLILQPLTAQPTTSVNSLFKANKNNSKRLFFIYRDSLNNQDFSRLTKVISELNHHS